MTYTVKQTATKRWNVIDTRTGEMVEGGFFSREAAERCACEYATEDGMKGGSE